MDLLMTLASAAEGVFNGKPKDMKEQEEGREVQGDGEPKKKKAKANKNGDSSDDDDSSSSSDGDSFSDDSVGLAKSKTSLKKAGPAVKKHKNKQKPKKKQNSATSATVKSEPTSQVVPPFPKSSSVSKTITSTSSSSGINLKKRKKFGLPLSTGRKPIVEAKKLEKEDREKIKIKKKKKKTKKRKEHTTASVREQDDRRIRHEEEQMHKKPKKKKHKKNGHGDTAKAPEPAQNRKADSAPSPAVAHVASTDTNTATHTAANLANADLQTLIMMDRIRRQRQQQVQQQAALLSNHSTVTTPATSGLEFSTNTANGLGQPGAGPANGLNHVDVEHLPKSFREAILEAEKAAALAKATVEFVTKGSNRKDEKTNSDKDAKAKNVDDAAVKGSRDTDNKKGVLEAAAAVDSAANAPKLTCVVKNDGEENWPRPRHNTDLAKDLTEDDIKPEDVVFPGRHGSILPDEPVFEGYNFYKDFMEKQRDVYLQCTTKSQKTHLSRGIVHVIKKRGGRFLERTTKKSSLADVNGFMDSENVADRSGESNNNGATAEGEKKKSAWIYYEMSDTNAIQRTSKRMKDRMDPVVEQSRINRIRKKKGLDVSEPNSPEQTPVPAPSVSNPLAFDGRPMQALPNAASNAISQLQRHNLEMEMEKQRQEQEKMMMYQRMELLGSQQQMQQQQQQRALMMAMNGNQQIGGGFGQLNNVAFGGRNSGANVGAMGQLQNLQVQGSGGPIGGGFGSPTYGHLGMARNFPPGMNLGSTGHAAAASFSKSDQEGDKTRSPKAPNGSRVDDDEKSNDVSTVASGNSKQPGVNKQSTKGQSDGTASKDKEQRINRNGMRAQPGDVNPHNLSIEIPFRAKCLWEVLKNDSHVRHELEPETRELPEKTKKIPPKEFTDVDVVFTGRGGHHEYYSTTDKGQPDETQHRAYFWYKSLIEDRRVEYMTCQSKGHKMKLSRSIVDLVRKKGGRFLEKSEEGFYEDVGDSRAQIKTSMFLRDKRSWDTRIRRIMEANPAAAHEAALLSGIEPLNPPPKPDQQSQQQQMTGMGMNSANVAMIGRFGAGRSAALMQQQHQIQQQQQIIQQQQQQQQQQMMRMTLNGMSPFQNGMMARENDQMMMARLQMEREMAVRQQVERETLEMFNRFRAR